MAVMTHFHAASSPWAAVRMNARIAPPAATRITTSSSCRLASAWQSKGSSARPLPLQDAMSWAHASSSDRRVQTGMHRPRSRPSNASSSSAFRSCSC